MAANSPYADSIYVFVFRSATGDNWSGIVVADTGSYRTGQSIPTTFGAYYIADQRDARVDLSAQGLEDGTVYVSQYFDAETHRSYQPNLIKYGLAAGSNYLGSEYDHVGIDDFGYGGMQTVNNSWFAG